MPRGKSRLFIFWFGSLSVVAEAFNVHRHLMINLFAIDSSLLLKLNLYFDPEGTFLENISNPLKSLEYLLIDLWHKNTWNHQEQKNFTLQI